MNLILEIESVADEATGRYAAGIVVLDAQSSKSLYEMGYMLGSLVGPHVADYLGLIKAIELALPLNPAEVEIRCGSQTLINHITDADPIADASLVPFYERAAASLLQLDIWKIRTAKEQSNRPAAELAQRALESGGDITQAPRPRADIASLTSPTADPTASCSASEPNPARSPLPLRQRPWLVELLDEPGFECPARCHADTPYAFGPSTPAGFCIHAARAALNDGPLTWDDPDQKRVTTLCPECEVPLRISVAE